MVRLRTDSKAKDYYVFPTLVGVVRPRFSEGGQGYFVFPTLVGVVPTLCIAVIIYSRGLPHASGGGPY